MESPATATRKSNALKVHYRLLYEKRERERKNKRKGKEKKKEEKEANLIKAPKKIQSVMVRS